MPITWCYTVTNSDQPFCSKRSPIGCYVSQEGKPHDACFISVCVHVCVRYNLDTLFRRNYLRGVLHICSTMLKL